MADYFNPASFNPGVDFKPNSALGGMIWAEDRNRYNQLADMFQQGQGYDLAKKGLETSEFFQDAPIRQLGGQAKSAGYQADIETKVPRAHADLRSVLGQNEERSLKNEATRATQPSAIAKTIADNVAGKSEAEFKDYVTGWQKASGLAAEADQVAPGWRESGNLPVSITSRLDPNDPMMRNIMRAPNPGKVLAGIVEASPDMIKEMAKLTKQGENSLNVAKEQSRGSLAVANVGAAWHRDLIAAQQGNRAAAAKIEGRIKELTAKAFSNPPTILPGEREELNFLLQREFLLRQAGAGVAPGIGASVVGGDMGARMGAATPRPVQVPTGAPQQQQGPRSFATEQEALASGYKGNVIINGRPARID